MKLFEACICDLFLYKELVPSSAPSKSHSSAPSEENWLLLYQALVAPSTPGKSHDLLSGGEN
jgi:hypothetical protein